MRVARANQALRALGQARVVQGGISTIPRPSTIKWRIDHLQTSGIEARPTTIHGTLLSSLRRLLQYRTVEEDQRGLLLLFISIMGRTRNHKNDKHGKNNSRMWISSSFRIVVLCWLCILSSTLTIRICQAQSQEPKETAINRNSKKENGDAFLTDDSVILITGAAGFLGSELALALHRTYSPKL